MNKLNKDVLIDIGLASFCFSFVLALFWDDISDKFYLGTKFIIIVIPMFLAISIWYVFDKK